MGEKLVIAYCRVSDAQMETSLARQAEVLKDYCKQHGLPEPLVLSDHGISGFKDERPGYKKLLELCKSGAVAVVLVSSLDRLSRSARSTIEFFETAIEKQGIRFISLAQQVDSSSAQGKAFVAMAGVFSQLYRDEISAKVKAQARFRKERGLKGAGHLPFGFNLEPGTERLTVNRQELDAILLMSSMRNAGASYRAIAVELERRGQKTKLGLTSWNPKTVRAILLRAKIDDAGERSASSTVTLKTKDGGNDS